MVRFYIFFSLILIGCNSSNKANQNEKHYIHIDGSDTSRLRLISYENRFYGEIVNTKGGVAPVTGQINGDIKGDTLIGDNHYKPYRWKEKKRVPIVLLKQENNYLEGNGQMIEVMGILTYVESSIKFDNPKKIYKPMDDDSLKLQ